MSLHDKLQQAMMEKINSQKEEGAAFLAANKSKEGIQELEGGMQYQVLQEGTGGASPKVNSNIRAHYAGALLNGKEFDSSYKRGQPFEARVNQLIKGWQVALPMMTEGSKWRLWIPSDLGYGDRGAGAGIPGGATLVFDIELIKILD
ncbi:MAG TPA: FKBP-type peptidyl-prolyl cis-trans isomerase [Flavisolibacter sp.]